MDKFNGDVQNVWDASSMYAFKKCPLYYKYTTLDRLTSKRQPIYFAWGTAWHELLEIWYGLRLIGIPVDSARETALRKVVTKFGPGLAASDDTARNLFTLVRAFHWYTEEFATDPLSVAKLPNGEPALEVRFEVPIPETTKNWSMRCDMLGTFMGGLYVVENKSTDNDLSGYFRTFSPNIQTYSYVWVLRRCLGLPVLGYMVNAVQCLVSGNRFGRHIGNVTESQLDEFEVSTIIAMKHADEYASVGFFPMTETSCYNCQFRDADSQAPEHREGWLEADFKKSEWHS